MAKIPEPPLPPPAPERPKHGSDDHLFAILRHYHVHTEAMTMDNIIKIQKAMREFGKQCSQFDPTEKCLTATCIKKNPDPGKCYVVAVDFEENRAAISNGAIRIAQPFSNLRFKTEDKQ